jgi:hypothetical protein
MFVADLKGKLTLSELVSEDFLTSSVFSVFRYLGGDWLEKYLSQAVNSDDELLDIKAQNPEYSFWPWFSNKQSRAEPDVVIYYRNFACIIEAKNYSGKSGQGVINVDETDATATGDIIDQLWREYFVGVNNILGLRCKDFCLVYLTRHKKFPEYDIKTTLELFEKYAPSEMYNAKRRIYWLNWQKAIPVLNEIIAAHSEDSFQYKITWDLLEFMDKRNLGIFSGFNYLHDYSNFPPLSEVLFYHKVSLPYWNYSDNAGELEHLQYLFYRPQHKGYWDSLSVEKEVSEGSFIFYESGGMKNG